MKLAKTQIVMLETERSMLNFKIDWFIYSLRLHRNSLSLNIQETE